MPYLSPYASADSAAARPMVVALFVASCLLAIVSWYTTWQGMALYLAGWFSVLAATGIQSALVLVAWLIGFTRTRRWLLIPVYAITAIVSVAFSYVSLYTWFSARERPALVERKLYDHLTEAAGKTEESITGAIAEGRKHALALDEMAQAERDRGFISRAGDADPYLDAIRAQVAGEGRAVNEGSGSGPRYTAFDRFAKLARQSVEQLQNHQRALIDARSRLKPLDPTDKQLRDFRLVYDATPWSEIEQQLHSGKVERAEIPNYGDFVDKSASGQEDLMLAFQSLVEAPTSRHVFAFALAAFIDIVIFLLAYAAGPYLDGAPESRWSAAGAALESQDRQVFVRQFLRKLTPSAGGVAKVGAADLTPGEQQFCVLLSSKGQAHPQEENGKLFYLLDEGIHESLMESLVSQGLPLRGLRRDSGIPA